MEAEKFIVVATDHGFEMFDAETAEFDESGHPQNLVSGTEYAVLDGDQATEFVAGRHYLEFQDEARHVGAFAITFKLPPAQIESQTV